MDVNIVPLLQLDSETAPLPVLDMELVGALQEYFPAGAPVVHLLRASGPLLPSESAHLSADDRLHGHSIGVCLAVQGVHAMQDACLNFDRCTRYDSQATVAILEDGTTAVEIELCHGLMQWPFLSDITIAWAAASIFEPPMVSDASDSADIAAAEAAKAMVIKAELQPWIYINCILRDSQVFVPVCDPVRPLSPLHLISYHIFILDHFAQDTLMEGVTYYFGGGAAAMNMHERLADLLLMGLSFSMEDPGLCLLALKVAQRGHN